MIRVGIGGWNFEPWQGEFYPPGLARHRELAFAAAAVTSIEINGTFYRSQTRATFEKWAASVPDDFVFAVKAPRYAVNRKQLSEAGESIERFTTGGLAALGAKLGPILWQLPPTRRFDPAEIAAFLALLPARAEDVPLRHAIEVRHASFAVPEFTRMAADAGAAIVFADADVHPSIDEATADFTYARLQRSLESEATGYAPADLEHWAQRARGWATGGRDVFVYFISGAKVRNPAAAGALIGLLGR